MAYVPIPKDLTHVKTKVAFNLTKRQLICFGSGLLIGVPLFFLLRSKVAASTATLGMILVMLPAFLLGMYEKNGRPLEKILRNVIQVCLIRPKERPYRTNNYYAALERQYQLEKEVLHIVQGQQKTPHKKNSARKKRHSSRCKKSASFPQPAEAASGRRYKGKRAKG